MGFFSLCGCEVEVHSGNRQTTITPSVFMGKCEAEVLESDEFVPGTRLRFAREATKSGLIQALETASEFCPLDVRLEGRLLPRRDFLEGALYRDTIDGIEVGFSTQFKWQWSWHHDSNWNFYGLRIADPFDTFTGLLGPDARRRLSFLPEAGSPRVAVPRLAGGNGPGNPVAGGDLSA